MKKIFVNTSTTIASLLIFAYSHAQSDQTIALPPLNKPVLAQSDPYSGNEGELGKYATYSSKKQSPYGVRAFVGFNFSPSIRARFSNNLGGGIGGGAGGYQSEYSFLHRSTGAFLAGA